MQFGQGTTNLDRGIDECVQRRDVSTQGPNAKGAHRGNVAMRCRCQQERATRLLMAQTKVRTYFVSHVHTSITKCLLTRGLTRTRDVLTRVGTGRPLKASIPAGRMRV